MTPFAHPGFVFRGKTYKTITGLLNALTKRHPRTNELSGVHPLKNTIEAYERDAHGHRTLIAIYAVTPPVEGLKQYVAEALLPADVQERRDALIASAYNVIASRGLTLPFSTSRLAKTVMSPGNAKLLSQDLRIKLLCTYSSVLMEEQQAGQQMIYTFADANAALMYVNV